MADGFRWAPASLLGNNRNYIFSDPRAKCDAEDLHVRYAGYIVTRHKSLPQTLDELNQCNYYSGNLQDTELKGWMRSHDDCEHSDNMSSVNKGIELDKVIKELTLPATVLNPTDSRESAFVSVTEERGGVIYAIFITKVYVRKPRLVRLASEVRQGWKKHFIETDEILIGSATCVSGHWLPFRHHCTAQSLNNASLSHKPVNRKPIIHYHSKHRKSRLVRLRHAANCKGSHFAWDLLFPDSCST